MNLPIRKRIKLKSLFSGIGRKFILYFIFFSIVPLIFISVLGYKISERIFFNQNFRNLRLQNELVKNRLNNFFQAADFEISPKNPLNTAFYSWIGERLNEPLNNKCKDAQNIHFFFEDKFSKSQLFRAAAILDSRGKIRCFTDSSIFRVPDSTLLRLASRQTAAFWEEVPDTSIDPLLMIIVPISIGTKEPPGHICGILNNQQIYDILNYFSEPDKSVRLYLLNREMKLLYLAGFDKSLPVHLPPHLLPAKSGQAFMKRWDGEDVLRAYEHIPAKQWVILSEINYRDAMHDILIFRNQAAIGMVLLLILLGTLAIYYSRRFTIPIRQLAYTAQDIGDGLLETPIKISSPDEIGLLARELDEMRRKLLDYYLNLENKVKERTDELKSAQFQIMQQEKMASLGLMAAGIAHEIGNPITSISSLTQVLKRRLKNKENLNYLDTIMKNIERISRIVREMVDFSRPSNYEIGPVNINEIAHTALGIVKYDSRSRNINFILDLKKDIPTTTLVADQLLQVIINILFNAVDAMEGYGKDLTLATRSTDNSILIEIQDTGCGIPENQLNKIFEPFYTTKEVGKGTGLGLSVSYGIIKNFHGDLTVESQLGKGSTFRIKLPVNQE